MWSKYFQLKTCRFFKWTRRQKSLLSHEGVLTLYPLYHNKVCYAYYDHQLYVYCRSGLCFAAPPSGKNNGYGHNNHNSAWAWPHHLEQKPLTDRRQTASIRVTHKPHSDYLGNTHFLLMGKLKALTKLCTHMLHTQTCLHMDRWYKNKTKTNFYQSVFICSCIGNIFKDYVKIFSALLRYTSSSSSPSSSLSLSLSWSSVCLCDR